MLSFRRHVRGHGGALCAAAALAVVACVPGAIAFTEGELGLGIDGAQPGGVQAAVDSAEVVVVRSADDDGTVKERPIIAGSGTAFRDCKDQTVCPQMLVVPSTDRSIELGTIETVEERQDEKKVRSVTLQTFAIGKFEVSVPEYLACVAAGACREPEWREAGGQFNIETGHNDHYKRLGANVTGKEFPIVGVSWDDAVAYAAWLSKTTGQPYRLPTDAEWEYAARAGTRTLYWWGNQDKPGDKTMAACRGCGSEWDGVNNAPVASFPANRWGLHNVHGNVWEWVADFYCDDFRSGRGDGGARDADDCPVRDAGGLHVLRGGSSFYEAKFMKASARLSQAHDVRNVSAGFRVARTLVSAGVR